MELRNDLVAVCALFVGVVSVSCTKADSSSPPKDNGMPVRVCIPLGSSPVAEAAVANRGTWIASIVDERSEPQLASLRVEWTYAVVNGKASAREACVETERVRDDVSIVPTIRANSLGDGGASFLLLTVDARVLAPARVVDGKTLNHPEATLAWNLKVGPTAVDASLDEPASSRVFVPAWNEARLGARESKAKLGQATPR
jgi:hypothetical protein